jgi:hypothetical protein
MRSLYNYILNTIFCISLLTSSLILGDPRDQVKANQVSEDFNTFTEVDTNSDILVTSSNLTFNTMGMWFNSYVYKDMGIDEISGDLIYDFDFNISSAEQGVSYAVLFAVSNNNTGFGSYGPGISAYGRSYFVEFMRPNSPNEYQIRLVGSSGASQNSSSAYLYINPACTYYARFSRVGSTADLSLYTNAGRTNQYMYTLEVTSSSASFRYIYGLSTE